MFKELKEPASKGLGEFKEFISKGNVIDLAVGVIIGAAFGKIVSALVADIFMPILGIITGGIKLSDRKFVFNHWGQSLDLPYGSFLQAILDFFIIALALFFVVKFINRFRKKEEKAAPSTPEDVILLREIRDLLKDKP
ncbi:MAG: large-conductance mechanosensitive channel protein MscL [Chthoniobacterales bacterium]